MPLWFRPANGLWDGKVKVVVTDYFDLEYIQSEAKGFESLLFELNRNLYREIYKEF